MSTGSTNNPTNARRQFLRRSAVGATLLAGVGSRVTAGVALSAVSSSLALAAQKAKPPSESHSVSFSDPAASRRIHLVNAHTWDDLDVVYYTHGIYIDENIHQLNHLMRDRRANVSMAMDLNLYDQLLILQKMLKTTEPVHILSGYRTPETNAKLRARSSGVAKYSLHMEGKAADIYIPGIPVKTLQRAALSLNVGGVGLYSKSNFVHVDTGHIRHWGS